MRAGRQLSKALLVACTAGIWLFVPFTHYGPTLHLYILDVGQGDSLLIETPDKHRILIDGGPDDRVVEELDAIMPFWDREIDAVLPTHPHADHIQGLVPVLKRFEVGQVLTTPASNQSTAFRAFNLEIDSQNIKRVHFMSGSLISTNDNVTIQSLWPPADTHWQEVEDLNDVSQVCWLRFGEFTALLMGDAEAGRAQDLAKEHQIPTVTVLKVGHHGSAASVSSSLLQQLDPLLSVISVGSDNRYGHPAPTTIQLLVQHGSRIMRTDQQGTIAVRVDSSGISVTHGGMQYN